MIQNVFNELDTTLKKLLDNQETMLQEIQRMKITKPKDSEATGIGDFISEKEAMKMLGKKTTWFWNMRDKGTLPFSKTGNKVFYHKKDIIKLLESNMNDGFKK